MYNTKVSVSLLLNMGPLKLLTAELDRLMTNRLPENVDLEGAERLLDIAVACNTAIDRLEQAVTATATVSDWRQGLRDIDDAVVYTDDGNGTSQHGPSVGGTNDFNALHATYTATLTRVRELRESSVELLMLENASWRADQVGQLAPNLTRHENEGPQEGPTEGLSAGLSAGLTDGWPGSSVAAEGQGQGQGRRGEENGGEKEIIGLADKKYTATVKGHGPLDDSAHAPDSSGASKAVLGGSSHKSEVGGSEEEEFSSGEAQGRESPLSEEDWMGRPSPTSSSLSRVSWPSVTLDEMGDVATKYENGGRGEGYDGRAKDRERDRERERGMASRHRLLRDGQREYYGTPCPSYLAPDPTQPLSAQPRGPARAPLGVRGEAPDARYLSRGLQGTSTSASSCWSNDDVSTLTHVTFTDVEAQVEAQVEAEAVAEVVDATVRGSVDTPVSAPVDAPVSALGPVHVSAPPVSASLPAPLPAPLPVLVRVSAAAPVAVVTASTSAVATAAATVLPAGTAVHVSGSAAATYSAAVAADNVAEAPTDPEEARNHNAHLMHAKIDRALRATRFP